MKVAIALYGVYSEIYWSNNYSGDLFFYTFESHLDTRCKVSRVLPSLEYLPKVSEISKSAYYQDYMIRECRRMIRTYEEDTEETYDIIIYTTFKTILVSLPNTPGEYYTRRFSYVPFDTITKDDMTPLDSFEIVSDTSVRFNGGNIEAISSLSLTKREMLFSRLFAGKVMDYSPSYSYQASIIFLIPSVISPSTNPFNYTPKRSVFSSNERFQQTLAQVKAICSYGQVFLLEGSELTVSQLLELTPYVRVVYFTKNEQGNHYANRHPNKSIYEVYVMRRMLEVLSFKWIFKFGGRYHLLPTFNLSFFLRDKPVFKTLIGYTRTYIVECVIYSIPGTYRNKYIDIYREIIKRLEGNDSIENLLYVYSKDDCYTVPYLHVIGNDAIEGMDKLL